MLKGVKGWCCLCKSSGTNNCIFLEEIKKLATSI